MTHTEILSAALKLAITAPSASQADKATQLAQDFVRQFNLSPAQVEACKAATLQELKL
jgi:hypothetical protein